MTDTIKAPTSKIKRKIETGKLRPGDGFRFYESTDMEFVVCEVHDANDEPITKHGPFYYHKDKPYRAWSVPETHLVWIEIETVKLKTLLPDDAFWVPGEPESEVWTVCSTINSVLLSEEDVVARIGNQVAKFSGSKDVVFKKD